MVNIIVYVSTQEIAEKLIHELLTLRLVAHASVDIDNKSYILENEIIKKTNYVVTAQTKAMLFGIITEHIKNHYSENITIFSMPITQCNDAFFEYIAQNTKKI